MDLWFILMEFVILLGCAFLFGTLAQKFGQSPILGYILTGIVVGPFINNSSAVNQVSELGVSLLLFSIGLEFSFRQLMKMGRLAFGGGGLQVLGTLLICALVLSLFITLPRALTIGAIIALSSTTLVLRMLVDKASIDSIHGRASLSILLFQDIAIVPLVLMISFFVPSAQDTSILSHIFKIGLSVSGLILVFYLLLYQIFPKLLSKKTLFENRELTVLFAISIGLGATWAAHTAHISPALGAFVAGILLGESPYATQIRADIGSLRTIMVTLFFASVGMLAKPLWFIHHLHWILLAGVLVFLFKALLIYGVTRIFGLSKRYALATGIGLAQVGEFSFVLATTARDGGVLDPFAIDLIISVIIVLMLVTPYMVTGALPIADWLFSGFSKKPVSDFHTGSDGEPQEPVSRVLVVGLGPSGRHVVQTLKDQNLVPLVIDTNPDGRVFSKKHKFSLHLGDAAQEDILKHAGLMDVCMAVITVPDPVTSIQIVRMIRRLRPDIGLVVRCRYNRHLNELKQAGATIVVDEETTMGEMLSRKITEGLEDESGSLLACRLAGQTKNT